MLFTGNRKSIQTDDSGNNYFRAEGSGGAWSNRLVKVYVSNPESPTRSTIYDSSGTNGGEISGFLISKQGDAFLILGARNGSALIKKSNGGIQNIAAASQVRAFVDGSGHFYWIKYGSEISL